MLNIEPAFETGKLEYVRGKRNLWCSGGMRRYHKEDQRRRQLTGTILTLMDEG